MSKAEATIAEETFASKLGIEMTTPRVFEELIELHAGTRIVITAVGPSGIGKTAIPKQVAKRRNDGKGVPYIPLHVPTMTLEDCHIPTMSDEKAYFDRRVSRRFKALFDWVTEVKKGLKKGEAFPPDMCPILAIEELNRGVDKSVTRAIFTMLDDRMVGDMVIPDEVQMIVTMNPTGGGMAVNEFERDPAMRRRLLPIGVAFHYSDFIKHATTAKFHPNVIAHLGAQPDHVYDELAAAAGKVFACPATWENVSRICWRFQEMNVSLLGAAGRAAIAGAIGTGAATVFLEFVKDHTAVVTPEDVLTGYATESEVRKRFRSYLTDGGGRLDKVTDLCNGLAVRIFVDLKRKPEAIAKQTACFINDLPTEIIMAFLTKATEESNRLNTDGKQYLSALNVLWAKEPLFNEALKRLHESKLAVERDTGAKVK
jgi:hypothetical protein